MINNIKNQDNNINLSLPNNFYYYSVKFGLISFIFSYPLFIILFTFHFFSRPDPINLKEIIFFTIILLYLTTILILFSYNFIIKKILQKYKFEKISLSRKADNSWIIKYGDKHIQYNENDNILVNIKETRSFFPFFGIILGIEKSNGEKNYFLDFNDLFWRKKWEYVINKISEITNKDVIYNYNESNIKNKIPFSYKLIGLSILPFFPLSIMFILGMSFGVITSIVSLPLLIIVFIITRFII